MTEANLAEVTELVSTNYPGVFFPKSFSFSKPAPTTFLLNPADN